MHSLGHAFVVEAWRAASLKAPPQRRSCAARLSDRFPSLFISQHVCADAGTFIMHACHFTSRFRVPSAVLHGCLQGAPPLARCIALGFMGVLHVPTAWNDCGERRRLRERAGLDHVFPFTLCVPDSRSRALCMVGCRERRGLRERMGLDGRDDGAEGEQVGRCCSRAARAEDVCPAAAYGYAVRSARHLF